MTRSCGGSLGIAHAQVDHVGAGPALLVHQLVDLGEQVRRQPANPLGHLDRKRPVLGDRFVFGRDFVHDSLSGLKWKPIRGRDAIGGGCISCRIAATND